MADVKVSQLPEASSADPGDFFLLSDTSGAVSKKIDALNVATGADKGALSATLISADSDNVIVQGSDNLLYSSVQDPDVTAPTLISADADNVIVQGSDDLLYSSVQDGSITAAKLADDAVTTGKILDGAITLDKLAPSAIGGLPVGAIIMLPRNNIPSSMFECNGATFDAVTYPALNTYLGGNTLPDLRGEFVRGWDNGRGVDTGRVIGSAQSDQMESHVHPMSFAANEFPTTAAPQRGSGTGMSFTHNTGSAGGTSNSSENRPRNIALIFAIQAE